MFYQLPIGMIPMEINIKRIIFQNIEIQVYQTKNHPFLIENSHLAEIFAVFEHLLNSTYNLNKFILKENYHFIYIDNTKYWTKFGIIRMAILLQNVESLEFADFIEELG